MAKEKTYGQMRLISSGIKEKDNSFPVLFFDNPIKQNVKLFKVDENENLLIRYVDLDGEQVYYDEKGKLKEFFRKRLKEPIGDMKYLQAKKSGIHIYWTPGIINKFKDKKTIDTLFITEGELKAFDSFCTSVSL